MLDKSEAEKNNQFKFRALKVYSSTEWLADNKKKYRQVFDRYETTYVYAELSFYNKLFDEDDWDVNVELKCFSVEKGKAELCALDFHRKVNKYDNVVYIREGWGNKSYGAFWKKGTYYWEAWVEEEKVATKYFYVEEAEKDDFQEENAYIGVESVKLYEGPYDDFPVEERVYYKEFDTEDTRYIYAEISLKNLHVTQDWQCEVFTKFYNNARELKGEIVKLQKIEAGTDTVLITAGWGSNVKGSWRADQYTAEVIFLDKLVASVAFKVGELFEEGINQVYVPYQDAPLSMSSNEDDKLTFEEVMMELDALVGLQEIKQKVREHAQYLQFLQLRKDKGFEEKEEVNVHSVFIGNPGTGKTTVAGMMGRLYRKMGLLSKGHVHEVDRVDLVGEYIGQTAPKVKEAIEKARGGVLFIDEAYALARSSDDRKDFGREVIEILVKEMSNGKGDLAVIVAGYPKEMNAFLDSNPGLKSRFKHYFEFKDYLPQALTKIAQYAAREKAVVLESDATKAIGDLITEAYRTRDRSFGNARFVHDLIEKAKIQLGLRVMSNEAPQQLENTTLETVILSDVQSVDIKPQYELPDIPIDEALLERSMNELDQLIGMKKVKEQIKELVKLVRFYRETGRNVLNSFFLHTAFVGNPGTGKTTVARILTSLYKALGVLERGQMIETDRQGLVAGYVGQTAIKTAEKIEEAMGGVLFIDEAYALSMRGTSTHGDFGDEAIQTLLKRMEDHRGQFFLFAAGYPDNMEAFLKANPGLNSRFDKILKFDDYTPVELMEIALFMLHQKDIFPTPEAKEHIERYLAFLYEYRDKYFGNARTVRQVVAEAIKNQNLRIASLSLQEREKVSPNVLTLDDVASFTLSKEDGVFGRKGIGFRKRG
ncbi:MAG: AAA family ATPase [Bacteroidota bacterium]